MAASPAFGALEDRYPGVRVLQVKDRFLGRQGLDPEALANEANRLLNAFGSAVGAPASLTAARPRRRLRYLRRLRTAARVFGAAT